MAFVDQGEFEAMKTLSGRRAPRCDKHQFVESCVVGYIHVSFFRSRANQIATR